MTLLKEREHRELPVAVVPPALEATPVLVRVLVYLPLPGLSIMYPFVERTLAKDVEEVHTVLPFSIIDELEGSKTKRVRENRQGGPHATLRHIVGELGGIDDVGRPGDLVGRRVLHGDGSRLDGGRDNQGLALALAKNPIEVFQVGQEVLHALPQGGLGARRFGDNTGYVGAAACKNSPKYLFLLCVHNTRNINIRNYNESGRHYIGRAEALPLWDRGDVSRRRRWKKIFYLEQYYSSPPPLRSSKVGLEQGFCIG